MKMKTFVLSIMVLVLSIPVLVPMVAAQGQFPLPQVGDRFTYNTEGKTFTLTYIGVVDGVHQYSFAGSKKSNYVENLDGQMVSSISSTKYSPHAGWRPTVVDRPHDWKHTYAVDGQTRDMTCHSSLAGARQVGAIRFEKTVTVACEDLKRGFRYPRYHELVWAVDLPVVISHNIYWHGRQQFLAGVTFIQTVYRHLLQHFCQRAHDHVEDRLDLSFSIATQKRRFHLAINQM